MIVAEDGARSEAGLPSSWGSRPRSSLDASYIAEPPGRRHVRALKNPAPERAAEECWSRTRPTSRPRPSWRLPWTFR